MQKLIVVAILAVMFSQAVKASDFADVASTLVVKHIPEAEWQALLSSVHYNFKTWSNDNDCSDMGRYLNEKLIQITHSVPNDVPTLQKVVCWLALYKEYNQPLPGVIAKLNADDKAKYMADLEALDKDFTWEKALALFRQRLDDAKKRGVVK